MPKGAPPPGGSPRRGKKDLSPHRHDLEETAMANGPRRRKSRRTFGKIVKLPSGKYRASYIGPDGERRAAETTFPTVADADAWLSVIAADVIRGDWRPPEPARETFGSYAERWLATGLGRNGKPLSPTTKELYRILWDKWLAPTF